MSVPPNGSARAPSELPPAGPPHRSEGPALRAVFDEYPNAVTTDHVASVMRADASIRASRQGYSHDAWEALRWALQERFVMRVRRGVYVAERTWRARVEVAASRLSGHRERNALSVEEAAARCGVPVERWLAWERERETPTVHELHRVAWELQIVVSGWCPLRDASS